MIIQHNLPAMNAHRQMGINNNSVTKSLEKLSSGFSINRAGDNAAGLAISEKMRGQISGLNQAAANSQDAISLIQTAEGALNETHSILQRMRELSVQSANGTYDNEVDRANINKETEALKSEIDRIATSTHFNGKKLLDGSLAGGGSTTDAGPISGSYGETDTGLESSILTSNIVGTTIAVNVDVNLKRGSETAQWDVDGKILTFNLIGGASYTQAQIDDLISNASQITAAVAAPPEISLSLNNGVWKVAEGDTIETKVGAKAEVDVTDFFNESGNALNVNIKANKNGVEGNRVIHFGFNAKNGKESADVTTAFDHANPDTSEEVNVSLVAGKEYTAEDLTKVLQDLGLDYTVDIDMSDKAITSQKEVIMQILADDSTTFSIDAEVVDGTGVASKTLDDSAASGEGITFQIGANGSKDQRVSLTVADQSSSGLGIKSINLGTQEGANVAIDKIDTAINRVSSTRADLGALQNRLEHTITSLGTASENLQAAESRIRDVDMAKEMMAFTKNQIISQASQAMLAQANTLPQGVLQLLR